MEADISVWLARVDGDAHHAMRRVLSACTGIAPCDLRFARRCAACGSGEHGKPRLVGAIAGGLPSFSIARSNRFAVIAVCADREIGVDVEDSRETPPSTYSWCHPNERQTLRRLSPLRAEAAALRLWVRREAVLKAMGVGLGVREHDLDLSGMPAHLTGWTAVSQQWMVTDLDNPDRLIISLATGQAGSVTIRRLVDQPYARRRLESQLSTRM